MAGMRQWNPSPKPATRAERDRAVLAALVRLYEDGCYLRPSRQPVGPGDIGQELNWPGYFFNASSLLQPNLKRLVAAGLVAKVPVGPAHRGNRYKPTGPGISTDACYRIAAANAIAVDQLYAATMPGPCGDAGPSE